MKVEVVLGQVGEDPHVERDARRAVKDQTVGGDFHRAGPAAAVHHLPHEAMDVGGLGRGAGRRRFPVADVLHHRPDQARAAAGMGEKVRG